MNLEDKGDFIYLSLIVYNKFKSVATRRDSGYSLSVRLRSKKYVATSPKLSLGMSLDVGNTGEITGTTGIVQMYQVVRPTTKIAQSLHFYRAVTRFLTVLARVVMRPLNNLNAKRSYVMY